MKSQTKVAILLSATTMCVEAQTELHEQIVFDAHASSDRIKFVSSRQYDIAEVRINDYLIPTKLNLIVPPTIGKETIKFAPQAFSWMNAPNTDVVLDFRRDGHKFCESQTDWTRMFYNSCSLVSVNFEGVSCKPFIKKMTGMFEGCSRLKQIFWGDLDTSNVIAMDSMFRGCEAMEEIDLSNFKTTRVETMNHMFSSCHKLKSLDLRKLDASNVKDINGMFKNCNALKFIDMCLFRPSLMQNIDQMFIGRAHVTVNYPFRVYR